MSIVKNWLSRNFISIYFSLVFVGAILLFLNGYIPLSKMKQDLVKSQQEVSEINSNYEKLVKRIEKYESSTRGKITWEIDEDIRLRILEINNILSNNNAVIYDSNKVKCSFQYGYTESCKRLIEHESFIQEHSYLTRLHDLTRARYNFDRLYAENSLLREKHALIYGQLQGNNNPELFSSNQNAAALVANNRMALEIERVKIKQYQSRNTSFGAQQAKVLNMISPLYAHIYDIRQLIESHWITKISKPVFGSIPLLVFILFIFSALTYLTQLGFRFLDQRISATESKPHYLNKISIFLIVLCCIPALMILAYKSYPQSEHSEAVKRRSAIISDLYVKIDNAQKNEEKLIRDCASTFAGELSVLKEREENIGKFTEEVLSLKAQWIALKEVAGSEEYQKLVASNFSKFIISPAQMESRYKLAAELCLRDIESIENNLFVSMGQTYIEQTALGVSGKTKLTGHADSIGRVATEAKHDAWIMTATNVTTLAAAFVPGINIIVAATATLATDVAAEKVVSGNIKDQVNKVIDNISGKASNQFREELTNLIQLRNEQLKKKLGEQI